MTKSGKSVRFLRLKNPVRSRSERHRIPLFSADFVMSPAIVSRPSRTLSMGSSGKLVDLPGVWLHNGPFDYEWRNQRPSAENAVTE